MICPTSTFIKLASSFAVRNSVARTTARSRSVSSAARRSVSSARSERRIRRAFARRDMSEVSSIPARVLRTALSTSLASTFRSFVRFFRISSPSASGFARSPGLRFVTNPFSFGTSLPSPRVCSVGVGDDLESGSRSIFPLILRPGKVTRRSVGSPVATTVLRRRL